MNQKNNTDGGAAPDKPHISPSQLNMYTKCGEQYRRRYIKQEKLPPGISLVRGIGFHKGAEHNFKQKIDTMKDLGSKEIQDVAVAEFETVASKQGLLLSDEEKSRGQDIVVSEAKDQTAEFAKVLIEGSPISPPVAPKYFPVAVEEKQRITLPSASHDLLGIIDLEVQNDEIVDFKTSAKTKNQADIDKDGQLTFYSLLKRARTGRDPSRITIENFVALKTTKVATFHTQRTMDDYEAAIARINKVVEGINAGYYPPANEGSWWCGPKWCGYWSTCEFVNSRRK